MTYKLRFFRAVLSALLPLVMLMTSAPAWCGARASRSAGLVLTGILEDFSVEAVSAPAAAMRSSSDGSVTLQSNWAVRAHMTTIRMSARIVPQGAVADPERGAVNVFTQSGGATNFPVSRTDQVRLARQAAGGATTGTVQIMVQAL